MKHEPKKHFDISKPRRHVPDPTSKPIIVGHHPMMPDPMIREEREKAPKPISVSTGVDDSQAIAVGKPEEPAEEPAKPADLPGLADISAPHEASPALTPSAATTLEPGEPIMPQPATEPHPGPQPPTAELTAEHAPGAVFSPAQAAEVDGRLDTPAVQPQTPATLPSSPSPVSSQAIQPAVPGLEPPVPAEPPAGQELHIPAGHGHAVVHHKPRIWVWVLAAVIAFIWIYAAIDALTSIKLPIEFFTK